MYYRSGQSLIAPAVFLAARNSFFSCSEFISVWAALIAGVSLLGSAVAADGENKAKLLPGVTGVVVKLLKVACWCTVVERWLDCFLPDMFLLCKPEGGLLCSFCWFSSVLVLLRVDFGTRTAL